jgi:hypothetical protein
MGQFVNDGVRQKELRAHVGAYIRGCWIVVRSLRWKLVDRQNEH